MENCELMGKKDEKLIRKAITYGERTRPAGVCEQEEPQRSKAMDFPAQLNIAEELTCPMCLQLLTEPLSLDCGHSFCQACITANNESVSAPGGECHCPVCQSRYQPWNLCPNLQLANIVKKLMEVKTTSQQWQGADLCEQHGENRLIFCKEDGKAICKLCVLSVEHHGHQMFPIEQVAQECQEKLQEALKRLTEEEQEAEKLEADISDERATWKNHMQTERQKILEGFDEMRGILDREQQRELQKLEDDEVNVLDNLAVAKDQVAQQRQYMGELILDLQHQIWGSSIDTLQDVINVIRRSESWTLKKPKIVSKKLKSAFRAPDLGRILQLFKELTEVQSYWVDFKLNPVNSPSAGLISEDQRQVTVEKSFMFKNVYPCNPSSFDVLGCQNFSSGKYYWEVDVSGKRAWILGVFSNISNFNTKKSSGFVFNPNVNYQNIYSRFRPENGYWVVGLQNESEYNAFEDSSTADPKVLTLFMAVPPCRVGVFLDYEAGTLSFFNITNHGSLIYKFSKCRFPPTVYPYFNPWNCPAPMTLCQPNS
ncbi:PREDICTED: E3 ubiquitin-protein ligase TRIM22-like isoform X1 [Hipposideros armiger]|uniref:E3 ubiquitin-protein ligase TRIM22-like isoform X1 n=2 Tax=Hipposideros armiger TaxID=186990 RepID=A0A8B7TE18_HIPAR|nr:PREDICTED: E3 ubiquitin-protein ligase TRIM22-like isoform X1 [Hipposideros armiger]